MIHTFLDKPSLGPSFSVSEIEAVLGGPHPGELLSRPDQWVMYNATGAASEDLVKYLEDIFRCREIAISEKRTKERLLSVAGPLYRARAQPYHIVDMWQAGSASLLHAVCNYRKFHNKPNIFFVRHKKSRGILWQGTPTRYWKDTPEPFVLNLHPAKSIRGVPPLQRMFTPKKRPAEFSTRESVFVTWVRGTYEPLYCIYRDNNGCLPEGLDEYLHVMKECMPEVPLIDEDLYNKTTRWTRYIDQAVSMIECLRKTYMVLQRGGYALRGSRRRWLYLEEKRKQRKQQFPDEIERLLQVDPGDVSFLRNHQNQMMAVVQGASGIIDRTAAMLPETFRYEKPKS